MNTCNDSAQPQLPLQAKRKFFLVAEILPSRIYRTLSKDAQRVFAGIWNRLNNATVDSIWISRENLCRKIRLAKTSTLINGGLMDTNRIIADIDTEISKLQQARALLSNVSTKKGPGRPKSTDSKLTKRKKRKLSAKGRAAISAAMKARWAKSRKTAKKATKTASPAKAVKTAPVG